MDALRDLERRLSEAVAETYAVNNEEDINAVYLHSNGKGNSSSSSRGASSARKHMSPQGFLEEDREDNLDWESRGAGRAAATPNEVPLNSIVGASAQQTTPEALHRVSGVLEKRRGELSSLRPAATLDEFRNSSHGSAKSAINSLLTSERVLRPLRSLIVQSYLQRPERFSLNLGELLTELAEEEQQGARQANSGALGNGSPSSRARQSDAHVGLDAEVAEENPYYLAVDMLEVELANILSTVPTPRLGAQTVRIFALAGVAKILTSKARFEFHACGAKIEEQQDCSSSRAR
ncbi:Hypothetical Protein FCC1311_106732 [Hondaea fermentalgiana]|uniref:Uncharacterized protein n=1 Tax=Hondaea fermentalgiana TaxID=2315210 RepID=A0A2R5GVU5_9STRA|nr:Hypothetical Protein FCC1311_106732 [Hondaea fermentalgiana]|eukprot:GBG34449.1 Hypothetical Protein FCC1311_106732 [Hondaea fermentalgiana]